LSLLRNSEALQTAQPRSTPERQRAAATEPRIIRTVTLGGGPLAELGHATLAGVDAVRRATGRSLDAVGLGPQLTPSHVRGWIPGVQLRMYGGGGVPVLLVPAPIKRWYIWDLTPEVSVVRRCLHHGLRVSVAEWLDVASGDQRFGLEDYADQLLMACVRAVLDDSGEQRVVLVGHSLGGTFAAICAARHPDVVSAVALLESPLHFGADAGVFAPLVAVAPHAGWLRGRRPVPGSFLNMSSAAAAPLSFQVERYADFTRSLAQPELLATHLRVQRWTLDEFAVPGQLFEDVVERLYRRDELMTGTLTVAGSRVGPSTLVAPLLNVVNPHSAVIPPQSVVPFHEAAASPRKALLQYHGDVGVALQHVGVLVGRNAHRTLWPQVLSWIDSVVA
jgi:polyhydroxyalkanoate synthase subunit PhaC